MVRLISSLKQLLASGQAPLASPPAPDKVRLSAAGPKLSPPGRMPGEPDKAANAEPGADGDKSHGVMPLQLFGEQGLYFVDAEHAMARAACHYIGQEAQRERSVEIFMFGEGEEEFWTRTFREVLQWPRQFAHEHIATLVDFGWHEQRPFIVYEFTGGYTLEALIKQYTHQATLIPVELAAFIGTQAARALAYAHSFVTPEGPQEVLYHRVQPRSIALDDDGRVKLLDWGLPNRVPAMFLHRPVIHALAPEKILGQAIDARAEQYELAAVMYALLSADMLFPGDSEIERMHKMRDCVLPDFDVQISQVPVELREILRRALSRSPRKRFASCAEFADQLEPFSRGIDSRICEAVVRAFLLGVPQGR